jgi:cellulose synthase/poly-beta-1,6-N-acetylglucosamine synthase-like glycosyltransferase/spore germination protein YaaH/peptidoglycan/xylan/chitin deacetylase (PgdA/CDA1 family)
MAESKPIFYDQERRRWRRTRLALEIAGAIFTLVLVIFLINVVSKPELPEILRPNAHAGLHSIHFRQKPKPVRQGRKRRIAALGKIPQNYDPLRAAFYVDYDPNSLASLQQHYHDIDVLIPETLHSVTADGTLHVVTPDGKLHVVPSDGHLTIVPDPKLAAWMESIQKSSGVELPVMAMMNNSDGTVFQTRELSPMMASPTARHHLIQTTVEYATAQKQAGIVLDFESIPDADQASFKRFVAELGKALRSAGLKFMVALPAADWSYDYAYLSAQADAIILMNYDFHWATSSPGPIASQDWFAGNIQNIVKLVPPEKLVMGIANYSYDWPAKTKRDPHPVAQPLTFQEAITTAQESEAQIEFDSDSLSPHFSYEDENNLVHNVWMLDGLTAYNELRAAERAGVRGTAVWRLGQEDPSIWSIWDATHPDDTIRKKLEEVPPGYDLILEGDGDIWHITATPESGRRSFDYDASSDLFTDETFESYPLSWRIQQMGAVPKKMVLSFDDGPDPQWTPKILDILKQKQVPATFFVIGESANQEAGIVRREYREGHEVANHTFTHPEFESISRTELQLQLNMTELLLESSLGVKTLLFRPPYGIDHQPETASEIQMLPIPQSMGYIIVGARIDPHDWGELNGGAPPPVATIVSRVLAEAATGKGNIILMHDGGGDRSRTVEALPEVIDALRAKGYEFVSVAALLGQTRAQVMPPLSQREWLLARADAFIFDLFRWFRSGIAFIFVAGILLVGGRALIIGMLALVEKFRPAPKDNPGYKPEVTVLIPAFNEESVIETTVRAALASDYPKLEILVINDGSADRTAEIVLENFGRDPRVRLLTQSNHGKPSALNHGLSEATGQIIISIDADTMVDPSAISKLVRHFADPNVGAVAGNVKVENRNRWLTRWQALEYITSQNLEKRAFDLLNCIPVVPGAAGAWRTDVLRSHGGFSGDTVAEDTDLTLTIRREGSKILYDEEAIGRTEVPDTIQALIRQRFRWTFGTLQAVWKHRDAAGKPKYGTLGWIAIPNIFLFQIVLPLFSPVIDLLFILTLALWALAQLRFTRLPQLWTAQDVERSLIFFAIFMLIDLFTCIVAFALERHEDWTLLAPLIIQRFYYRQMMYVVLFLALKEAVQGRPVGWRGVEPRKPVEAVQA